MEKAKCGGVISQYKKKFLMHPAVLHESVCSYMWLVKNKNRPWCMVSRASLNRNGSVAHSDCALYEVGGNIGEWKCSPTGAALTFACLSAHWAHECSEVLRNEVYKRQRDTSSASAVIRADKCLLHTCLRAHMRADTVQAKLFVICTTFVVGKL